MHRFLKWRDAISVTRDYPALLQVMADYVNSIPTDQRARLPVTCQHVLKHSGDIQGAAVTLLQTELTFQGDAEVAALLHEIAHTFASASFRLGQLNNRPDVPADSSG
jgi:hypothetical protein